MTELLLSFKDWLFSLFKKKHVSEPPHETVAEAPHEIKEKPSREHINRSWRLSEILDGLDETWSNLKRASATDSGYLQSLSKEDLNGLKKIGPIVVKPNEWNPNDAIVPLNKDDTLRPSMIFIAVNCGQHGGDKFMEPDFFFAIKVRKPPWSVAKIQGQAYQVGMGWRDSSGKVHWGLVYAYIKNGEVIPAQWLCTQYVNVKGGGYVKKTWAVASWRPGPEAADSVKACFSNALAIYDKRHEKWSVAVNKDGMRATFLIDKSDTSYSFKDRDATALAADGKRKRIIHFVREHVQRRATGDVTIPAHIRGVREFDWFGYHVFVTAPKHHVFLASDFPLAAEEMPEDTPMDVRYMNLSALAADLVKKEETGNVRVKAN